MNNHYLNVNKKKLGNPNNWMQNIYFFEIFKLMNKMLDFKKRTSYK